MSARWRPHNNCRKCNSWHGILKAIHQSKPVIPPLRLLPHAPPASRSLPHPVLLPLFLPHLLPLVVSATSQVWPVFTALYPFSTLTHHTGPLTSTAKTLLSQFATGDAGIWLTANQVKKWKYRQIEKTHVSPWEQHSHPFTRHIDVSPIYQSFYRDKHFGLSSLASLVDENMGEVATSYPNTSQHGHRNTRRDDDSKPFHDNKKRYAERGPIVKIIVVICVRF